MLYVHKGRSMSTVLLTPTHIASDHCVIRTAHPLQAKVDLTHRKLFIPEHRQFAIATVGEYYPQDIDDPIIYQAVEDMLTIMISHLNTTGKSVYQFEEENPAAVKYRKVVDLSTRSFWVTRRHRFVIHHNTSGHLAVMASDDIGGMGSGGFIGIGLLKGGRTIHNVWKDLNRLDPTTSVEHTVISLSSLKPWKVKS